MASFAAKRWHIVVNEEGFLLENEGEWNIFKVSSQLDLNSLFHSGWLNQFTVVQEAEEEVHGGGRIL